jgi:hypothetical protein
LLPRSACRSRPWVRSPLPRWLTRSTLVVAHLRPAPVRMMRSAERMAPALTVTVLAELINGQCGHDVALGHEQHLDHEEAEGQARSR